jgi:chromosome segregation ATPase
VADEQTLAFLQELERADSEIADTLAKLDELAAAVDGLRRRTVELEAFRVRLPAERARLSTAKTETSGRVAQCREELAAAENELREADRAGDEHRSVAVQRAAVRARDALHMAERAEAEADAELEQLNAEARAVEDEGSELVKRATRLATELRERPRLAETAGSFSGQDLAGVAEWAGAAFAALFVARGSLAGEREALIRQANELGAAVLGEPVYVASAAQVARRVRQSG